MSLKINATNTLFALLFFPPSLLFFLGGPAIVQQVSIVLFLCFGFIISFIVFEKPKKIDIIQALLLFYGLYIIINVLVRQPFVISYINIRDFAEILRISSILVFFYLGFSLKIYPLQYNKIALYLAIMHLILLLGFTFFDSFFLNKLYNAKMHKFSGMMPGINYIWVPLSIMYLSFIESNPKKILTFLLCIFALMGSLVTSLSFTSSIVIAFIVTFLGLLKVKTLADIVRLIFIISLLSLTFYIAFDFIAQYQPNISKFLKLKQAILELDISKLRSLHERFSLWERVWPLIMDFPIFGHGADKANMPYTENSFLMTLYRYGFLGLLIELSIFAVFLTKFFSKVKESPEFYIPIALIFAQLIASMTSHVMYELKAPYLLFFLYGYYWGKARDNTFATGER